MYSDGMSVVMWIGRVGSVIGSPCGDSAPRRRVDRQRRDVVVAADQAADPGSAVARRDIEDRPRGVRPAVMHIGRQRDRAAAGQGRGLDIDIVMRQLRPDARVKRDAVGGHGGLLPLLRQDNLPRRARPLPYAGAPARPTTPRNAPDAYGGSRPEAGRICRSVAALARHGYGLRRIGNPALRNRSGSRMGRYRRGVDSAARPPML